MRLRIFIYLVVTLLLGVSTLAVAAPDLIGRWRLSNEFAETVPEECRGAFVDVAESTVTAFSGAQMVTAEYKASKKYNDFVILFSNVRVNDQPNCQGVSPEIVQENFAKLQIWRMVGDKVKVFAPSFLMEMERT